MSHYIKDYFTKEHPLEIDQAIYQQYVMCMLTFETRQKHPQALNSPYIAVDPVYFTTQDTKNLFDVFGVDQDAFTATIKKCPAIDKSRKVTSDPFNLLSIYAIYATFNTKLISDEAKEGLLLAITKMLHYKFFTSLVKHMFPYGADANIMRATINNLTEKFDIVKYGTWKKAIEARCEDLLSKKSIHYKTMQKFDVDADILYIISDTQTRIRSKIKNIVAEYYHTKELGLSIGDSSMTMDVDGEKILVDQVGVLDAMITNLGNHVLNINQWLDSTLIHVCVKLFGNVNETLMRQCLTAFSQYATLQSKQGKLDEIQKDKNGQMYVGARILMKTILQKTYRFCIQSKVNMKNQADIIAKTKNTYSASRIQDKDILEIKESVGKVINDCVKITRESTKVSLRIAFICYIIMKSFAYL